MGNPLGTAHELQVWIVVVVLDVPERIAESLVRLLTVPEDRVGQGGCGCGETEEVHGV
jgi:hypothetical protein